MTRGQKTGRNLEAVYSDHIRLDERSLALHRLIARKVLADPALLDKARANLRRWQESGDSPSLAFAEWAQILTGPRRSSGAIFGGALRAGDSSASIQPVLWYSHRG